MTTPWSDTPPSPDKPDWYHTKEIADGEERPMWMSPNGNWDDAAYSYHTGERLVQFGPRVLSAEETVALTAEVERLRAAAAELAEIKRAWGMAAKDL